MNVLPPPPRLPQLEGDLFLTDGGLETTLVFLAGIDLPAFAAFPLLDTDDGRSALRGYFAPYLDVARRTSARFVLDTPTWRANPDWGTRLGYDGAALVRVNRASVDFARGLAADHPDVTCVIDGVIGPRGDGYVVGETMSPAEAASYHRLQCEAFASAGADMVTGVTMTYADEATGLVQAATGEGLPVVVSFTVETDGRLPSGQALGDAVREVDAATGAAAAYFMVNCAHPSHFVDVLQGDWLERVKGIRANASAMSHAELDQADELDRGDPGVLAEGYRRLRDRLPDLRVVGGCCGTDHEHVAHIIDALRS